MVVSAQVLGQREQHRLGDVEVTRVFARRQLVKDHKSSSNIGHMWSRFHNTFLRNLRMGPTRWSICPWQAFPAYCSVTLQLIGPIQMLQKMKRCAQVT